jgi:RelE-like toxin of type II toxin-antitoxin system HigB
MARRAPQAAPGPGGAGGAVGKRRRFWRPRRNLSSSSAKADDPVRRDAAFDLQRPWLLDAPLSRGMTSEKIDRIGDRKEQWAMTVNERWRICFEFRQGDAHNVEIVDYHKS